MKSLFSFLVGKDARSSAGPKGTLSDGTVVSSENVCKLSRELTKSKNSIPENDITKCYSILASNFELLLESKAGRIELLTIPKAALLYLLQSDELAISDEASLYLLCCAWSEKRMQKVMEKKLKMEQEEKEKAKNQTGGVNLRGSAGLYQEMSQGVSKLLAADRTKPPETQLPKKSLEKQTSKGEESSTSGSISSGDEDNSKKQYSSVDETEKDKKIENNKNENKDKENEKENEKDKDKDNQEEKEMEDDEEEEEMRKTEEQFKGKKINLKGTAGLFHEMSQGAQKVTKK